MCPRIREYKEIVGKLLTQQQYQDVLAARASGIEVPPDSTPSANGTSGVNSTDMDRANNKLLTTDETSSAGEVEKPANPDMCADRTPITDTGQSAENMEPEAADSMDMS